MEIPWPTNETNYIDQIIMAKPKNERTNQFYKVVRKTNTYYYAKLLKTETKLIQQIHDNSGNIETEKYESRIIHEYMEGTKEKRITLKAITRYPIIYCNIVVYEI